MAEPTAKPQQPVVPQQPTMRDKLEKNLSPQQKAAIDKAVKEAEERIKKMFEHVFGKKTVTEQLKDPHSLLTKLLNAARNVAAIKQETSFIAAIIMAVIKHFEQIIKHLSSAEKWNKAGHPHLDAGSEEAAERQQVIRIQKAALAEAQERQQHFNEITKDLTQALQEKEKLTEDYLKEAEPFAAQSKLLEEKLVNIEVNLQELQEAREELQAEKTTTYDELETKEKTIETEYQNAEQQFKQAQAAKTQSLIKVASENTADLMPGTTAVDRDALFNQMLEQRNPIKQKAMLKQYCQDKSIPYSESLFSRVSDNLKNIHAQQKAAEKDFAQQPVAKAKTQIEEDFGLYTFNFLVKENEQEYSFNELKNAKTTTQAQQAEVTAGSAAVDQKYKPLFDENIQKVESSAQKLAQVAQPAAAILNAIADKEVQQNQDKQQESTSTNTSQITPLKTTLKPPGTTA